MNPIAQALPSFLGLAWRGVRPWRDGFYVLGVLVGAVLAFVLNGAAMNGYERAILAAVVPVLIALGVFWRPIQPLLASVAALAVAALALYQGDLARAEQNAALRYLLSSQSAILWMALLLLLSTLCYWLALLGRGAVQHLAQTLAGALAWMGVAMALVGTMVRWHESHLLGPDVGYIPVSNLYEVFVLFCWLTTLLQLYYASRHAARPEAARGLGAFAMLVVSAAVGFLLWYAVARQAYGIQPLVPALDSWWMKLHVPANFIGYGSFALAAMAALAYLLQQRWPASRIARALPDAAVLDDVMYKAISLGFAFFTVATILGALWAAEAWGGYWSWDPKETWALIVWLNYAAWLHMRLIKGLHGSFAATWALVGLAATTFAFLGVNLFLSGLHSYGEL
ncbi:MAG: Cytochrome c biogenesis protein CcsA [Paracidovorax wautersii]|uniref:Cytochrome c biogenesis protein CcsA n=1 Tax=Paracidovorax wautersii TaxID=1177982 RepID=A0A7V8JRH1_9BURK|nr:MAG: Cytochrome c biogenesis protein CcsA [Paracidovorax wautersii]